MTRRCRFAIEAKVRSMYTDPMKIYRADRGHPATCPVYMLRCIFDKEEAPRVERECILGALGCVRDNEEMARALIGALEPTQARISSIEYPLTP